MVSPDDPTTAFWALGSQRIALGSGIWCYRRTAAQIDLANFAHALRPAGPEALDADLARLTIEHEHPCRKIVIDRDTPTWVEAVLVMREWTIETELRLVLPEGVRLVFAAGRRSRTSARTRTRQIGPADDLDPHWSARAAMFRIDHLEEDSRHHRAPRPRSDTDSAVDLRRGIEQHATYHCVTVDHHVVGFVCTWCSPDGDGVIEDVFVHPDHRGTGVATDLLLHGVQALREDGAGAVVIAADPADTPRHLYQRLGFIPHAVIRTLVRQRAITHPGAASRSAAAEP